jgi:NADPH:quinone reductase-like Zn-dependent oxidoreductase
MRAFVLEEFDAPPTLRDDVPEPEAGDGTLLVRVAASSVNPVDSAIASGALRAMAEYRFPVTLGRDFAGTVEAAAGDFQEGDQVYGYVLHVDPDVHNGSWAELAAVPADGFVDRKPAALDTSEAGTATLAGVTAIGCVVALDVGEGDAVFVVGATGGVGSFAVQLAAAAGARVVAAALPEDEDYLRGLGVHELIERGDRPEGADALLDVVSFSHDEFEANAVALKEGGRGVSPVGAAGEGPGRSNVMGSAELADMRRLTSLLEDGTLKVPIQRSYGLAEAGMAMRDLAGEHTRGKLAIEI